MEGFLLVPPERGTIIGRAVWKSRFIVLGHATRTQTSPESLPRTTSATRLQSVRKGLKSSPSSKEKPPSLESMVLPSTDQLWLSIYKQKGDWEYIAQIPVKSINSCEIKTLQYRKPGPSLPTLVITFEPDPSVDKSRKRRSSRTGGLTSSQNTYPNSFLFRTLPEERFNIYDWQITIQPEMKPSMEGFEAPMSPQSPMFDTFINPFAASLSGNSSKNYSRPELHHRGSSTTYASIHSGQVRDRPNTSTLISPSPSLRSKSSDISSSQASFFNRPLGSLPIQQMPIDLPSPATSGFDDGQSILGWTSAQGRSSALSNHTRAGSNSVSVVGTPPAPRETILDRAFMMRCIPGSDRLSTAEEDNGRISSIARFEALMKEAEDRRKAKDAKSTSDKLGGRKSSATGWELEEEDEESDSDGELDKEQDYDDGLHLDDEDSVDPMSLSIHEMPTPAQRALEYISGRTTPLPQRRPKSPTPPLPTSRPQPPLRSRTAPPVSHRAERPRSLVVPSTTYLGQSAAPSDAQTSTALKRTSSTHTTTSTKRLSFTEFAKRLSSTSSLLLVQTNASSGSTSSRNSHQSSDGSFGDAVDTEGGNGGLQRGLSQSRLSGMAIGGPGAGMGMRSGGVQHVEADGRSHWRGSGLGVFGGEGGFL